MTSSWSRNGRRSAGGLLAAAAALSFGFLSPAAAATFQFFVTAGVPVSLPQPVTDLTADIGSPGNQTEGRVTLTWTAPDAYTPIEGEPIVGYTVKYASFSVASLGGDTTAWWNLAPSSSAVTQTILAPGGLQTLVLSRLETGATLYFAIRSTNSVTSQLSPIDSRSLVAPAAFTVGCASCQAAAVIPNFLPPPVGLPAIVPLCGQLRASWTPLDTTVTYDFDRYRLMQSSQTIGGPYVDVTGGPLNVVTQQSTGTVANNVQTLKVLENFVTYYYEVLAYDKLGAGSVAPSTAIATAQAYAVPASATSMQVQGSSTTPSLFVTWSNPTLDVFKGGILVKTQGTPLNAGPVDFSSYTATASLGGGTVVAAWNSGANQVSFADTNLAGGTTYEYHVFNLYQSSNAVCYSAGTSGSIVLQPRPMAPAGVTFSLDQFGFSQISWTKVEYFDTGALMHINPGDGLPPDNELAGYNVYKSTCGAGGCGGATSWEKVNVGGVVAKTSTTFIVGGAPAVKTYYLVRGVNNFAFESPDSNSVDSSQNLYAVNKVGDSTIAQAIVPPALKDELKAANNASGVDLTVNLLSHPEDLSGTTLRSIEIQILRGDNGAQISGFLFKKGTTQLSISNTDVAGLTTASHRTSATSDLDIFWFNGVRYLPMNGDVNSQTETVTVNTSLTGKFQLRNVSRSLAFSFDPSVDLLPRVITPNGDGLNDIMFFNTKVTGVTGKLFDIRGAKVADLKACPGPAGDPFNGKCLYWDGMVSGKAVHGGIYIYDLNGQGKHYTGTVVVAQ